MKLDRENGCLILILVLALLLRLVWVILVPTEPISDYGDFDKIALNVATGRGDAVVAGQPTAYRPPAYPLLLAGIYAVFGHSVLAARLVNVLLGALTCFLAYLLATQLFDRRVGLLSALIVAGFPSHILHGNILATENLFIPVLLGAFVTFVQALRREKRAWPYWILAGVLVGLGVLTRPALLLLPAVWGLVMLFQRVPLKRIVLTIGVVGVAMVAVVAPWTVRNAIDMGEFIPVATEGGITFLAGHNERALQAEYSLEGPAIDELNAVPRTEAERDSYAYQLAFRFIWQNPGTEVALIGHKFWNFFKDDVSGVTWNVESSTLNFPRWSVLVLKGLAQGYYMLVALLAIAALFLVRRVPKDRWYVLLYALFVYWTALHLAFYGKDRFRLPLMPVFAIFAAVTLTFLWNRRGGWFRGKAPQPEA